MTPTTLLLAATLLAHDWYPTDCCSGRDCRPVPCDEIHDNEYRGAHFTSIRPSEDNQCHACFIERHSYRAGEGAREWIAPLCLFIPKGIS